MSRDLNREAELYLSGLSLPQVATQSSVSISTLRLAFKARGILRTPQEAQKLAGALGRKATTKAGRRFSEASKAKMRASRRRYFDGRAKGYSVKQDGYAEVTTGEHKFKGVHRVIMERHLGRPLKTSEHVHHVNHNRSDNRIENLQVLDAREHARLHATENHSKRKRNQKGEFA